MFKVDQIISTPDIPSSGDGIKITFHRQELSGEWTGIRPEFRFPVSSIPDVPTTFRLRLFPPYLVEGGLFNVIIARIGPLNGSAYFLLSVDTAGGHTEGILYRWDGSAWIETQEDAWFRLLLPQSVVDYGLHEEVVRNPALMDPESARAWGSAVIAGRQAPIQRGTCVIPPGWNQMVESQVPMGLVRVHGLMATGLRPERVRYTWSEGGPRVQIELGSVLPALADLLDWFDRRLRIEASA